ncbi:MAG: AAA family ATPase [Deltaproteobacteria bacterium]|nr:AAA family ATPase [Deltaproteobacteria bacterium]
MLEFAFTAFSGRLGNMPHTRLRHLQESFDRLIKFARIIGILGHRQVGKTTFLKANARECVTLDDEDIFKTASNSPKKFIESLQANRSGIDECQLVPGLFSALKVKIGTSSTPGRFILTGSVRFTSRKAIRESLTGRISNLELLPFCMTEIENEPNSSLFLQMLTCESFENMEHRFVIPSSLFNEHSNAIERYLKNGGLPGLFHIRDERTRVSQLADILETILDRDIRLVYKTSLPYLSDTRLDDSDWITLIYRNIRAQFQYRIGERADFFHYKTRGGAMIPISIRTKKGYLGLIPILCKSEINLSLRRSADSFLKHYGRSKVLFITRTGKESEILNDRIALVPAQVALF